MIFDKSIIEKIKDNLSNKGYFIYKNLIENQQFKKIQSFWIEYFYNLKRPKLQNVIWQPYLGEKNKITFSKDKNQCLYRIYDFYWNKPIHEQTKKIVYELGNYVNKSLLENNNLLNQINDNNLGIYCSVSSYPINEGYLFYHKDKLLNEKKLYHHLVPLTFRSKHYQSGGLFIYDRNNNKIDIEDMVEEGDVIFYDGSLKHGVETIKGNSELDIGRIQTFSIPTNFQYPGDNFRTLVDLNLSNKNLIKYLFYRIKKLL